MFVFYFHSVFMRLPILRQLVAPFYIRCLMTGVALCVLHANPALADVPPVQPQAQADQPVDFTADELVHDDINQTVTASGHVEFMYEGKLLKANNVIYNLTTEIVTAKGDVVLVDDNGDVHMADQLELTRDMKDGYIKTLRSTLEDGSRFTAREGHRTGGRTILMTDATYTPCEPCKEDPSKPPIWQLRADDVEHDNVDKTVTYKNVFFDVEGVPVLYAPYFSHPDGTIKQKDGFLSPSLKLDSQNGTSVLSRYYWGLAPDRDATMGVEAYTAQTPRVTGEYRQRYDQGEIVLDGSTTYSERKDDVDGETVTLDSEMRGHLRGKGRVDFNDEWRGGADFNIASDNQYFHQYDVTSDNVIENRAFAERFSGRDYGLIEALAFQDLRTSDLRGDQPNILPNAQASFYGDPGQILGGRWRSEISALGLERGGSGDDMVRGSALGGWDARYIAPIGLLTTTNLSLRGDQYYLIDRNEEDETNTSEKTLTRITPIANVMTSYPMVKRVRAVDVMFEPIAAVTITAGQGSDENNIPNEDSQDVQLDASNLFQPNRYPGIDRVEDQSRVTYGARASVNADDGSTAELFLGQSYRFDDSASNFSENSGLNNRESDYVGRLRLGYLEKVTFDYGFQLAGNDLTAIRHEIDNGLNFGDFSIHNTYLFARPIEGIGVTDAREQIASSASYKFYGDWSARVGATYDLGLTSGLRQSVLGLDYLGQCVTFSATAQRNLVDESTGESETELMFRLGLKNLGEFQTSGIGLASSTSSSEE